MGRRRDGKVGWRIFFVEKFRLGLVKGDFWDKSRLNNPEYRTLVALHNCTGESERLRLEAEQLREQLSKEVKAAQAEVRVMMLVMRLDDVDHEDDAGHEGDAQY